MRLSLSSTCTLAVGILALGITACSDGTAPARSNTLSAGGDYAGAVSSETATPAPGLVAAYGFNEQSGTTITDVSGNNNTGGLGRRVTRVAAGKFGSALSFSGGYVTVPASASLNLTKGMTLEAWVNPSNTTTAYATAIMKEQPGDYVYTLYGSAPNNPSGEINTSSAHYGEQAVPATSRLPINTWTHLAATFDGATLRLFMNGKQVSSKSIPAAIAVSKGALRIGGNTIWGEYFKGMIDEVRIYNRALSSSEIQSDMTTPVGKIAPAIGLPPTAISITSGNSQTGTVGTMLGSPMVVKVTDITNAGVPGVTVNWAVASGGGSVSAGTSVTDSTGSAQMNWTLGSTVGAQTATASFSAITGSQSVTFSATGTASPAATAIALSSGNNQSAKVNTALPAPLAVKVTNASGAAVAGVTVNWAVTAGGGKVSAATSVTDTAGLARITWTMGATAGPQTATASATGLTGSPVSFSATATAATQTPAAIAMSSGNNQSATVNTTLPAPLVVKVTDASNAAVAGVTVNWAVATGGGSVSSATSITNATGLAQINWTLGSTAGTQTAKASVSGLTGSPVTFSATGTNLTSGAKVQRYISPNGSDANTGQDAAHPWKTFAKAFGSSGIGAGGELILLDGTYSAAAGTGYMSYLGTNSAQAPSGKGRTAALQTYVHALNPGNVTVVSGGGDALFVGRSTRKDSCITFEGIRFEGSVSLYNTLWITIRKSGVHDESQNGGSVVAMGTNDGSWGNSYNLIEDTWIWGKNRALAITYRSDHNVWRRVVLRGDGCSSAACSGSGNPNIGITTYESTFTELQNVFVVDRILGGGSGYADFATAQHTSGQSHGGNRWRGSASLQSEDGGLNFEWDNANTYPVADVADMVVWTNKGSGGINISGRGGSEDARVANVTVYAAKGTDLVRLAPGTTGSLKNVVAYGTGRFGINSSVTPTFADVFGTFTESAYNQTNCSTGCKTTDPTSDGATPSLQYPFRIESGSALSGTGSGGANYGATIVNQFGATGTHWGEAGYNTLTSTSLWPWPTQTTMKAQMCSGVTRGFCSGSQTFTQYVWGLLGHAAPSTF
jgi:hypothetical protein